MIAKISATENLGGALGYNFKKVEKGQATVLLAERLYQEKNGCYTMRQMLSDMQALLPTQYRAKKIVFHCSLNPHPDEKLSDEALSQIAREYMEALGYGKQPFIVFKHNDIEREHIHIVSLRVDSHGRKINDKFEQRRSKAITDAIEKKYGLIPSTPQKAQTQQLANKVNVKQSNIKEQIQVVLYSAMQHYTFCSLGELNAILLRYHLTVEEVKMEVKGKRYNGLVYVPINSQGKKVGTPISASELGRGLGYTALQSKMQRSKRSIKRQLPSIRERVQEVMNTLPKDEAQLQKRLAQAGLRSLIRHTAQGRIYGVTFVDDEQGVAVNGSRLGKAYTASQFQAYFYGEGSLESQVYKESSTVKEESIGFIESFSDALLEISPSSTSDDWKEAAWQRKLRTKNRPRLKRKPC